MNEEKTENVLIKSQTQNSNQNKNNSQKSKKGSGLFAIIFLLSVCTVILFVIYHYDKELVIGEVISELVVLIFSGIFYTKLKKKNKK